MLRRITPKLTYANVMATIAGFLALGGGAYAATHLGKKSVGTKQLKNNAVISSKVKDGSLQAGDFAAGQLPGPTFGAEAFSDAGSTPPASQATLSSGSVTTPRAGALYVFGHLDVNTNPTCSAGSATYALYVDGAGVPGTAVKASTGFGPTLSGIINGIHAGTHQISIGLACVGGNVNTRGSASYSAGAILLG